MRKVTKFGFLTGNGKNLCAIILLAGTLFTANCSIASAKYDNSNAENSLTGINDLVGIDPSADICTTGMPTDDNSKIFCFYNAATNRFLSIGGLWGTHASIDTTPYGIWFEKTSTDGAYSLRNKVNGSGTGTYIGINKGDLHMDTGSGGTQSTPFSFEKAEGYTETNKVYRIKNGTSYITLFPDNSEKYCNIAGAYSTTDANYKNQVWKILSKAEYYELFLSNPANMSAPLDASFLISSPGFRVNDTDNQYWTINNSEAEGKLFFGDNSMYCSYNKRGNSGKGHFTNYSGPHQKVYGKYFYCYSKGARNFTLYQDVKIHKAGWYVLRCNGFSTANADAIAAKQTGAKLLAFLFVATLDKNNSADTKTASASSLALMTQTDANTLITNNDGSGAGQAFFNGKYENQVQMCIDTDADGNPVSKEHPVTIRIGFYVEKGTDNPSDDEITAVDNFKLLYAGPRRNPELILDEDNTHLSYLTLATDEYKNSILHLKRTLNPNMWNSIILPVNLTAGQLKRTFGDNVKIAKLANLTDHSVQFTTIETDNDDSTALEAFSPYIIFPPVTETISPSYTAEKFYTAEGDDNSEWLGENLEKSTDENNKFSLTIPANHYDITMVTFDRDKFNEYVNTDGKADWVSKTRFTADGNGHMECLGTMAKTYDENGIIEGRDNLNGDYFMYKGKLIQVPSGNMEDGTPYEYGLKAFRCWFELTGKDNVEGGKPNAMSLYIDGIEDNTTGIEDIHTVEIPCSFKRGIDAVFNMNGQKIRNGHDTTGLAKGLYVVNGKKIVVR